MGSMGLWITQTQRGQSDKPVAGHCRLAVNGQHLASTSDLTEPSNPQSKGIQAIFSCLSKLRSGPPQKEASCQKSRSQTEKSCI